MQKPAFLLATLLLLLGLVVVRESRQAPLSEVESKFLDWLSFTSDPAQDHQSPAPLGLVEINDSSLQPPHAWPWTPLDYALFLQAALPLRPSVVAITEILDWQKAPVAPEQEAQHLQHQQTLHDLLLKTPKALLGSRFGSLEDPDLIPAQQSIPVVRRVKGNRQLVPEYSVIEAQPQETYRLSPALGFTNLPEASVRRVPLLFRYRGEMAPSFVLQSLMLWLQLTPEDIEVDLGSHIRLGKERSIPIDNTGAMLVNFRSQYQRIPCEDLLVAAARNQTPFEPGFLLLLSRTDAEARNFLLPDGTNASAGELFASAISTVYTRQFVRTVPWIFELALVLAAMLSAPFVLRLKTSWAWLVCIVLLVFYVFSALTVFSKALIVLPILLPLLLLLFMAVFRSCLKSL